MGINSQIEEEFNHEHANNYISFELDYYESDALNQPDNSFNAYHIKDQKKN